MQYNENQEFVIPVELSKTELKIIRSALSDYQTSSKRSYQSKTLYTKICECLMGGILEELADKKSNH